MNNEKRISYISDQITALKNEEYLHKDLLNEWLKLQDEVSYLTFGEEEWEKHKRMDEIARYLYKESKDCKEVTQNNIDKLNEDCKYIANQIAMCKSGTRGENNVHYHLQACRCRHTSLRNIEFGETRRTEIDEIVFTQKAIFIIEVKNTSIDVRIDENGNFYRKEKSGEKLDINIADKMNDRYIFIKGILESNGIENPNIESILVFNESKVQVTNDYPYIKSCYVSALPHLIDEYAGPNLYSNEDLCLMINSIKKSEVKKAYPIDFDIEGFKYNFAFILASIEDKRCMDKITNEETIAPIREEKVKQKIGKISFARRFKKEVNKHKKNSHQAGKICAGAIGAGVVTLYFVDKFRKSK